MKIYVFSDESGVFDREHNDTFVFGGLVLLSHDDMNIASRKYSHVERIIRKRGNYEGELKASSISLTDRSKIYRSLNQWYKFGAVIDEKRINNNIWSDKKHKQRYLDYAYKIGIKRLFEKLIEDNIIMPSEVSDIYFSIDEHSTATSGKYELQESLENEFKRGTFNMDYAMFFPPIFPSVNRVDVKFKNSEDENLIRAADIIANRIYYQATNSTPYKPFGCGQNRLLVTYLP